MFSLYGYVGSQLCDRARRRRGARRRRLVRAFVPASRCALADSCATARRAAAASFWPGVVAQGRRRGRCGASFAGRSAPPDVHPGPRLPSCPRRPSGRRATRRRTSQNSPKTALGHTGPQTQSSSASKQRATIQWKQQASARRRVQAAPQPPRARARATHPIAREHATAKIRAGAPRPPPQRATLSVTVRW